MKKIVLLFLLSIAVLSCGIQEKEIEVVTVDDNRINEKVQEETSIWELEDLINNQKFDEAIPVLKENYEKDSKNIANILNYMSALLAKWSITRQEKEYSKKALEVWNKALIEFPNNSELYRYIWYAYEIAEDYENSFKNYDKSIELDDKNAMTYSNRGHSYKLFWDYSKAEKDFLKAYEINQIDDHILINLAWIYVLKWDKYNEKAIELFEKVLKTSWNIRFKSEASYSIATLISRKDDYLMTTNDYEDAEKYYKKSIEFDPKFESWYIWLAKIKFSFLLKRGQENKITKDEIEKEIFTIVEYSDIAIAINPEKSESYIQWGFILRDLWYKDKGDSMLNKALELIPNDITLTKIEKENLLDYINKNK